MQLLMSGCFQRLRGGTTAVVCLIRGDTLFVAWLGDSQCILVRDSRAVQLVDPHKPDKPVRIQDITCLRFTND